MAGAKVTRGHQTVVLVPDTKAAFHLRASASSRLCVNFPLHTRALIATLALSLIWNGIALGGEIHDAIRNQDLAKIESLLKANPALVSVKDSVGDSPLFYAIAGRDTAKKKEIFKLLLAYHADINERDPFLKQTPLHVAAHNGRTETVELLLANKADVTAKDEAGATPLNWAANTNIAATLLLYHADISAKDNSGQTPLHWSAQSDNKEVTAFLLANKANIAATDVLGWTPLHCAAMYASKGTAAVLLENKADPNARDKGGFTPLHWALQKKNKDVAELLREHGGH